MMENGSKAKSKNEKNFTEAMIEFIENQLAIWKSLSPLEYGIIILFYVVLFDKLFN